MKFLLTAMIVVLLGAQPTELLAQSPISSLIGSRSIDEEVKKLLKIVKEKHGDNGLSDRTYKYAERAAIVLTVLDCERSGTDLGDTKDWANQVVESFINDHLNKPSTGFSSVLGGNRGHFEGAFIVWASAALCRARPQNMEWEVVVDKYANQLFNSSNKSNGFNAWGYDNHAGSDGTAIVARSLIEAKEFVGKGEQLEKKSINQLEKFVHVVSAEKLPAVYYRLSKDGNGNLTPKPSRIYKPAIRVWVFNTLDASVETTKRQHTDDYFSEISGTADLTSGKYFPEDIHAPLRPNDTAYSHGALFAYEYTDYLLRNDRYDLCDKVTIENIMNTNVSGEEYEVVYNLWKVRALCNLKLLVNPNAGSLSSFLKAKELTIHLSPELHKSVNRVSLKVGAASSLRSDLALNGFVFDSSVSKHVAAVTLAGGLWDDLIADEDNLYIESEHQSNGETMTTRCKVQVISEKP